MLNYFAMYGRFLPWNVITFGNMQVAGAEKSQIRWSVCYITGLIYEELKLYTVSIKFNFIKYKFKIRIKFIMNEFDLISRCIGKRHYTYLAHTKVHPVSSNVKQKRHNSSDHVARGPCVQSLDHSFKTLLSVREIYSGRLIQQIGKQTSYHPVEQKRQLIKTTSLTERMYDIKFIFKSNYHL